MKLRPPTAQERAIVDAKDIDDRSYAEIERDFGVSNGRTAYQQASEVWYSWMTRAHNQSPTLRAGYARRRRFALVGLRQRLRNRAARRHGLR